MLPTAPTTPSLVRPRPRLDAFPTPSVHRVIPQWVDRRGCCTLQPDQRDGNPRQRRPLDVRRRPSKRPERRRRRNRSCAPRPIAPGQSASRCRCVVRQPRRAPRARHRNVPCRHRFEIVSENGVDRPWRGSRCDPCRVRRGVSNTWSRTAVPTPFFAKSEILRGAAVPCQFRPPRRSPQSAPRRRGGSKHVVTRSASVDRRQATRRCLRRRHRRPPMKNGTSAPSASPSCHQAGRDEASPASRAGSTPATWSRRPNCRRRARRRPESASSTPIVAPNECAAPRIAADSAARIVRSSYLPGCLPTRPPPWTITAIGANAAIVTVVGRGRSAASRSG